MYFHAARCSLERGLSYTISCDDLRSSYLEIFLCPSLLKDGLNGMRWAEARACQCAPGTYPEQTQTVMVCLQKLLCFARPREKQLTHAYPKRPGMVETEEGLASTDWGARFSPCQVLAICWGSERGSWAWDWTLSRCACVQDRLMTPLGTRLADVGVADRGEGRNFGMINPLQ